MEKLSLDILGQKMDIISKDGTNLDLQKITGYYKKVIDKIAQNYPYKTSLEIALLAGLTITEELYSLAKSKKLKDPEFDAKAEELIAKALKQLEVSLDL